jgi:dienelactone hydrolase
LVTLLRAATIPNNRRIPGPVPMLSSYAEQSFTHGGNAKPVYVRGAGPAVIVIHEIPGISPHVLRFADWVVDAGFKVYLPQLVGTAGRQPSIGYVLGSIATICISREFAVLAAHRSSPVTTWLRALVGHVHADAGGPGVGAVGMCFSGNFVLAMMLEPGLVAPVLAQPSLPFPLGAQRKQALHVSADEWDCVKRRCAAGAKVLGLRFKGDRACPPQRFETLRRELKAAFEAIEIDDRYANPRSRNPQPHAVLTADLIDRDGEPTRAAAHRVIAFLRERLTAG